MTLEVSVEARRVSIGDHFSFEIQRTLRIPNDGKNYPLPPGFGSFPLFRVEDYADTAPRNWLKHGGVFFPMWQREAAWINFSGDTCCPVAVLIAAGKICAVTGNPWTGRLESAPQNYALVHGRGGQRWLDGFKTADGTVAQFVAMPLGMGYTVEKQLTGEEVFGGMQIQAFECLPEMRPERFKSRERRFDESSHLAGLSDDDSYDDSAMMSMCEPSMCFSSKSAQHSVPTEEAGREMGLAAGGAIEQAIKKDEKYGVDAFDQNSTGRVYIHIVNSAMFKSITGHEPPMTPISAKSYSKRGLPWFSTYEEDAGKDVAPQAALEGIKNVKQIDADKGISGQQDDSSFKIAEDKVKKIGDKPKGKTVSDGEW